MDLNKVMLIGRIGKDPELKYLPNGTAVANFSVATGEKWKDKNSGEDREKTEWNRCVAFGKTAEIIGEYLSKGSQVYVQGKLQTREWEKDGVKRYSTEILLDNFGGLIMLGKGSGGGGGRQEPDERDTGQDSTKNDFDDDLPF